MFLFPAALLTSIAFLDPKVGRHVRLGDWIVGIRARDRFEMVWEGW